MGLTQVSTGGIKDATVATADIADSAITQVKIANNEVSTAKLINDSVTNAKIADNAVTQATIAAGAVHNAQINASAAIAGTKISPNFGSQVIQTTASAVDTDMFKIMRQDNNNISLLRIFQDSSAGGGAGGCHINTANRDFMISASTNANAGDGLFLKTTGELGIGTTSPSHMLDISQDGVAFPNAAGSTVVRIRNSAGSSTLSIDSNAGNAGNIQFGDTDAASQGTISYNHSSNHMQFNTGAAERMRIDSNGNLCVGTSDTTLSNETGGDGSVGTVISKSSGFQTKATNHHTAELNRAGTQGGTILFFQNGTQVGNISVTSSATAYNTSSDYRLKENVVAISDGITRLKTLKPSRFNFIADKDTTLDGFLAHEVTAVPEAITGTKDEVVTQAMIDAGEYKQEALSNPIYQGIDQSKLVPLLVAAVQELIGKVEVLEAA